MSPTDGDDQPDGFLPYGRHLVEDDDVAAVAGALRSDALTGGPAGGRFEEALAALTGAREAVVCSSGTAALHLACLAAGLGPGETVVVPAMTFVASANAARFTGAEVALADVDADTGLLATAGLERALAGDPACRAVCPVHLNGQVAPVETVAGWTRERELVVIEDGCHALGTRYRTTAGDWARVGDCRFSDMTVFSFHPVKTIAMGEGGAVTTNDAGLAQRLRELRNHGLVREPERWRDGAGDFAVDGGLRPGYAEMQTLGYNYRASDIHCALGCSQLGKLDRFAARRSALMQRYDDALAPLAPAVIPVTRVAGCEPVLHLYPVLIDFIGRGKPRAQVMEELAALGIGTQVHYLPVHRQPYYRERYGALQLPGAERYYERVLSLPFFPAMEDGDVGRIVEALRRVLGV